MYSELLTKADNAPVNPPAEGRHVVEGTYRVQACLASFGHSRTGRDMFTVRLIVCDGPYAGYTINWHLAVIVEHPRLLHRFFANMALLGVSREHFALATSNDAIIRQIILTGAYLDVDVTQGKNNFVGVEYARRVL